MNMEQLQQTNSGVTFETYRLGGLVFSNRVAKALEQRVVGYPFVRQLRYAARIELEVLMDAIALDPSWRVHRMGTDESVIDADGLFAFAYGTRKAEYCSVVFYIY